MKDSATLKRPASPISPTEPVASPKRRRSAKKFKGSISGPSSRIPKTARSVKKDPLVWDDIPKEWTHSNCFLLQLPVELLDKITDPESKLEPQDHLACMIPLPAGVRLLLFSLTSFTVASTCRMLRDAYKDEIWKNLYFNGIYHTSCGMSHIFSSALETSHDQVTSDGKGEVKEQPAEVAVDYRAKVAEMVNSPRITKTLAMQTFKISDKDLAPLKFEQKRSPRSGYPMKLYVTAQVRALALRIHGGPLGHAAHIKRRAEIMEKSNATKAKNGTAPKKKVTDCTDEYSAAIISPYTVDVYADEYDIYIGPEEDHAPPYDEYGDTYY